MASDQHVNLFFESKALASDTFTVVRFEGEEAISRPFRFEIELVSDQPDIDLAAVLGRPATLSFQRGDDGVLRKIHGVLAEFEQGQEGQYGHYLYRAVLVPRLWMLSLSRQNQIYQDKSAIEIVEEELKGAKNKGPAELAAIGLTAQDFEFRLSGDYAKHEYVVQYQETDLDFISRLLEHEGVFYFFEHDDESEKIVFCDDNVHIPALNGDSKITYTPPSGTSSSNEESVQSLRQAQRQITAKMILKDYNYRTPTTPLQGEADIDDKGHGLISEYGNHFKTPEEGQNLAKVRAGEILCRKVRFTGQSDRLAFAAGTPFTLEEHYNSAFDQDYLLTRVRHTATQAFAEATGFTGIDDQVTSYGNEFTAIPLDVRFRPARVTPRPKLHGVMNGHVDASGPGTRAEIDAQGRYKLVMPFDLSGQAKGKATRWVRMAQPYGGSEEGMHFPLRKGTEVIWTCVDGDPDRPIITGVVPNPLNRSVINAESHTRNRIQTASGVLMEFQDGPGPKNNDQGQDSGGSLAGQQQAQRLDLPAQRRAEPADDSLAPEPGTAATGRSDAMAVTKQTLEQQQQQQPPADYVDQEGDTDPETDETKWFKVDVPNYDGDGNRSYLRRGAYTGEDPENTVYFKNPAGGEEKDGIPLGLNCDEDDTPQIDGVFDYTDENRTEITKNNREVAIGNRSMITIGSDSLGVWDAQTAYKNYMRKTGDLLGTPVWRHTVMAHTSEDTYQWGDVEDYFAGFKVQAIGGLEVDVGILGDLDVFVGGRIDLGLSYNVNYNMGEDIDVVAGTNTEYATEQDIIGEESVMLRVTGGKTRILEKAEKKAIWGIGGSVAALTATAGFLMQGVPDLDEITNDDAPASTWGHRIGLPLASAVWALGVAYAVKRKRMRDISKADSPTVVELTNDLIRLSAETPPTKPGSRITVGLDGVIELSSGTTLNAPSIAMNDKQIVLKVGMSKITMTQSGITFSASSYTFT